MGFQKLQNVWVAEALMSSDMKNVNFLNLRGTKSIHYIGLTCKFLGTVNRAILLEQKL